MLAYIGLLTLWGCNGERTLTVDNRDYSYYPAALVSLDKAKIIPLPKPLHGLQATEADLWIEPRDPEIASATAGMAADIGIRHAGRDAHVAVAAGDYQHLVKVPDDSIWLDRLPVEAIKSGAVFIVQSSSNRYFKVRIDAWDRGQPRSPDHTSSPEDKTPILGRNSDFMWLSFARIREH
jgi:hypothetical protein